MKGPVGYGILVGFESYLESQARNISSPVAILDKGVVYDCSRAAWEKGIRPGDSGSRAKMALPELHLVYRSSGFSREAHDVFSRMAEGLLAMEPEDQSRIFFEIPGTEYVPETIRTLLKELQGKSFHCIFGIASTKFTAKAASLWLWDRFSSGKCPKTSRWGKLFRNSVHTVLFLETGMEKGFLRELNLSYLWKLPLELRTVLKELGLRSIGDVLNVSRDDLSAHLGDWALWVREWALGKDWERVKRVYPEEPIVFQRNFVQPVSGLSREFLSVIAGELQAALIEKGAGPMGIEVCLNGDFPEYRRTRRLFSPVSSRESLIIIIENLLNDFPGGEIHSFSIKLFDILPVQRVSVPLLWSLAPAGKARLPLKLEIAVEGIQKKFGDGAVYWGREETGGKSIPPEILWHEEMMMIWDPVRNQGGRSHVQTRS